MKPTYVWHNVGRYSGFLALAPRADRPFGLLSLYVVASRSERRTVAWWETREGLFLCFAEVGSA
ncbi:MAG TPA: hypothetical protein VFS43_13825 [Polyangiaceae bacterium]|nr:hypothetical protein [Polyangiaceae bacterium]